MNHDKTATQTANFEEKTAETATDEVKGQNPDTGEVGGPKGPEPTRYGDWEKKGRCIDF